MTHPWDDFSKSLAESVPRRESLRRLGGVFAGAVLGPLGAAAAWAKGPDPCKLFCKCRNKSQKDACLAACHACNGVTSRLCGSCGSYACTDLLNDFNNCGACGNVCRQPGYYEFGACVGGKCTYTCVAGAVRCNGTCTDLGSDPKNCGACGNVCGGATPYCTEGVCNVCPTGQTSCNSTCVSLASDPNNCGTCGNVCPDTAPNCSAGACVACDPGLTFCPGSGCVDLAWDSYNCGACGNTCWGGYCSGGYCYYYYYGGGGYGYWPYY